MTGRGNGNGEGIMKYSKAIALLALASGFFSVPATAQQFSIDEVPFHLEGSVRGRVIRVNTNLQFDVSATVTVHEVDAMLNGFLRQVQFVNCEENFYGYSVHDMRIKQGPSENTMVLAVSVTGCLRGFFRYYRDTITFEMPVSFPLKKGSRYHTVELGELSVTGNVFVELVMKAARVQVRAGIQRAATFLNGELRKAQDSALKNPMLAGFNPSFNIPPKISKSYTGGDLHIQVFAAGTRPTSDINALLNRGARQPQQQALTQ